MHAPSAAELLDAWERGLDQPGPDRALCLLAAAMPDASPASLASMPIGRRDAALLELRECIFGPSLVGRAACPACGELLELDFAVGDIRSDPRADEPGGASTVFEGATPAEALESGVSAAMHLRDAG